MTTPLWACACGAELETIDVFVMGNPDPIRTMPGDPIEPCTCPRCPFCHHKLDAGSRCDNLDCAYCGLIITDPEVIR